MDIIHAAPNVVTWAKREGDTTIICETADLSGNVDRVQRMRAANINNATLGQCTYSIPLVELAKWANQFGISLEEACANDAILDRFIADGHQKFKVKGGWA